MRRCNLLITGDGVAIIVYRCQEYRVGVSPSPTGGRRCRLAPSKSATARSFSAVRHRSSWIVTCGQPAVLFNSVGYRIWGAMHERVCQTSIWDADELLQRLIIETVGWMPAQYGGQCDWSVAEKTEYVWQKTVVLTVLVMLHEKQVVIK